MITAREAFQLPSAEIPQAIEDDARDVLKSIDEHIRSHMRFPFPPPLTIGYSRMSQESLEVVCMVAQRFGWIISAQVGVSKSSIQGAQPIPVTWVIQVQPSAEAFKDALADFTLDSPQLVA